MHLEISTKLISTALTCMRSVITHVETSFDSGESIVDKTLIEKNNNLKCIPRKPSCGVPVDLPLVGSAERSIRPTQSVRF